MDFTLHQLKIFLKVAELGSITRAAEELYLTQPAVSIQLRNMQDQFDIPLTEVIGRRLYITPFGREVEKHAQRIVDEMDQMKHQTMAYKGFLAGELKVSVVSTAKYVMPYFLTGFMNLHQGLELTMDVTNKQKVIRALNRNEVDFAMVSVIPDKLKVNTIDLMENTLCLVASPGQPFTSNNPKQLEDMSLIFREQGSATRTAMETYLNDQNITPKKQMTLTSNEAVKQAVIAGLGVSIMPLIGIKNELQNGDLQIYPLKGLPIITHWQLVWLKDKELSPAARAYLGYMEFNKKTVIKEHFSWFSNFTGTVKQP
ncbi:LysR family transcriptional regulator [Robertkochia flava]|uniref:LysR family transcriptional regulator n=1 Tax=Robertkochia flava TaxID=3447986 RepID=UPI001CCFC8F5|nr:LysR family transcriptional regulator [Robertkochia marina]